MNDVDIRAVVINGNASGEGQANDEADGSQSDVQLNDHSIPIQSSTESNQLKQLLAQQQEQIKLLTQLASLNHGSSVGVGSTRMVEVRLRNITSYKGETGDALESWIATLNLQYDDYVSARGATERAFVAAAAGTLADSAVVWWQSIEIANRPTTWSTMKNAINDQFQSVTNASRARKALIELRQTNKQSVVEYAAAFRSLMARSGKEVDGTQLLVIERFIDGLRSDEIRRDLMKDMPKDLNSAIATASRIDGFDNQSAAGERVANMEQLDGSVASMILNRLSAMEQRFNSNNSNKGPSSSGVQQPYENRRDRGANKQFTPIWKQIAGMTAELVEKRRAAHQCYYCADPNHTYRDCADRVNKKPANLKW